MNEIKENVINKNFMITYDFSDNDFGGHIEIEEKKRIKIIFIIFGIISYIQLICSICFIF